MLEGEVSALHAEISRLRMLLIDGDKVSEWVLSLRVLLCCFAFVLIILCVYTAD